MKVQTTILKTVQFFTVLFALSFIVSCSNNDNDPTTNPLNNTKWQLLKRGLLYTPPNESELSVQTYLSAEGFTTSISPNYYTAANSSPNLDQYSYALFSGTLSSPQYETDFYAEFIASNDGTAFGNLNQISKESNRPCLDYGTPLKYKGKEIFTTTTSTTPIQKIAFNGDQNNPNKIILFSKVKSNSPTSLDYTSTNQPIADTWLIYIYGKIPELPGNCKENNPQTPSTLTGNWNVSITGTNQAGSTAPNTTGTFNLTQDNNGNLSGKFTENNPNGNIVYNLITTSSNIFNGIVTIRATDGFLTWSFRGTFNSNGVNSYIIGNEAGESRINQNLEIEVITPSSANLDNGNYGTFVATKQ